MKEKKGQLHLQRIGRGKDKENTQSAEESESCPQQWRCPSRTHLVAYNDVSSKQRLQIAGLKVQPPRGDGDHPWVVKI